MRLLSLIFLLVAALFGRAEDTNRSATASIELIRPIDKSLYVGARATFVVNVLSKEIDRVVIAQDEGTTEEITVIPTKRTYCKTINLHVGDNIINVQSYRGDTLVDTLKRELYFLSELFEGLDDEPEGFVRHYLHNNTDENRCKACHNMRSNVPTDGEPFEDVTKTTCYECHHGMMDTQNTHAPAANWLCLDCHDGQIGEYNMQDEGKSKYLVRDPVEQNCDSCHDVLIDWNSNKYSHGPVNDGRCIRCHNPHGSDNEFFLRKSIWDLCTTCHAEKATGKHIVSSFVFSRNKGAHPTKGPKDPARPERTFACSSCHNPHGSNGIFLLRMKGSMPFSVCSRCHQK